MEDVFDARIASSRSIDVVEHLEGLALRLRVLGDRLDDQVAIAERADVGDDAQPVECLLDLGFDQLAALRCLRQRQLDALEPGLRNIDVGLDDDHVASRPGGDLGDPGTHEPTADDADSIMMHESNDI